MSVQCPWERSRCKRRVFPKPDLGGIDNGTLVGTILQQEYKKQQRRTERKKTLVRPSFGIRRIPFGKGSIVVNANDC